jgi:hypothetical protein
MATDVAANADYTSACNERQKSAAAAVAVVVVVVENDPGIGKIKCRPIFAVSDQI